MNKRSCKATLYVTLRICAVALAVSWNCLYGEDLLVKKKVNYLGWQTEKSKFTTCSNTTLEIEDGKIQKTDKKCDGAPPPGPFSGFIKSVNVESWTFVLKTGDGKLVTYFYPELSRLEVQSKLQQAIKNGHQAQVTSPVEGRVDSIDIQ